MRFTNLCLISIPFIGASWLKLPRWPTEACSTPPASERSGGHTRLLCRHLRFGIRERRRRILDALANALGGTTVLMNGIAAPLYAVTDGQINAQVPFEVLPAGQTSGSVIIIVQRGGQSSAVKNFQVVAFSPGVFSIAGNGLGLANAISPDGGARRPGWSRPALRLPSGHAWRDDYRSGDGARRDRHRDPERQGLRRRAAPYHYNSDPLQSEASRPRSRSRACRHSFLQ